MLNAPAGTEAFGRYAGWYDAFNAGKDYDAEVDELLRLVAPAAGARWLDLGCGTGRHLARLHALGFDVTGVDPSPRMLEVARGRGRGELRLVAGRAEELQLDQRFDVVSMLFHVFDYVTDDDALTRTMANVAAHLAPGGAFAFDFWHSGGVEHDPPARRARVAVVEGRRLVRVARPVEDRARRRIQVHYRFHWDSEDGPLVHEERHEMRHFAVDELVAWLAAVDLEPALVEGWMTRQPLAAGDWHGVVVARPRWR